MKKILLTGSSQIHHIAELLSKNDYKTKVVECKNNKNYGCLLLYYLKYMAKLPWADYVYFVYAQPNNSISLILARLFHKKVILHWIGTDVYNYIHKVVSDAPYTGKIKHIAGSMLLRDELKAVKIKSRVIPIIPFGMELELTKMPQKHAALVYLPTGGEEFYRADAVRELAYRNPDIPFHIVANEYYEPLDLKNVIFHGRLPADEMKKLYNEISVLVRLPIHDGLSMMLIEALGKGKQVLYTYEHPYVYTPESLDMESVDKKFKEIIEKKPKVNNGGHEYILSHYTEKTMMELYHKYKIFE